MHHAIAISVLNKWGREWAGDWLMEGEADEFAPRPCGAGTTRACTGTFVGVERDLVTRMIWGLSMPLPSSTQP